MVSSTCLSSVLTEILTVFDEVEIDSVKVFSYFPVEVVVEDYGKVYEFLSQSNI